MNREKWSILSKITILTNLFPDIYLQFNVVDVKAHIGRDNSNIKIEGTLLPQFIPYYLFLSRC